MFLKFFTQYCSNIWLLNKKIVLLRKKWKSDNPFLAMTGTGIADGVKRPAGSSSEIPVSHSSLVNVRLKPHLGEGRKKHKIIYLTQKWHHFDVLAVMMGGVRRRSGHLIMVTVFRDLITPTGTGDWSQVIFIYQMKSHCFARKPCLQLSLWQPVFCLN